MVFTRVMATIFIMFNILFSIACIIQYLEKEENFPVSVWVFVSIFVQIALFIGCFIKIRDL